MPSKKKTSFTEQEAETAPKMATTQAHAVANDFPTMASESELPDVDLDAISADDTVQENTPSAQGDDLNFDWATAYNQLEAELVEARQQAEKSHNDWLRAAAETENVRRRAREDVDRANRFGVEKLATNLLPVKDSIEAALANEQQSIDSYREGVELTLQQLISALAGAAVMELNPVGEPFDPKFHQAISTDPNGAANTVTQVLQKGYAIDQRVLRPALVVVGA